MVLEYNLSDAILKHISMPIDETMLNNKYPISKKTGSKLNLFNNEFRILVSFQCLESGFENAYPYPEDC